MKKFNKIVVLYFNLSFVTFVKLEGSNLRTSRVFLLFNFVTFFVSYVLPIFLPVNPVIENANTELMGLESSSPFLTGMIYFYAVQHALIRIICMIFLFWNHKLVKNFIIRCYQTFELFKISKTSKDFATFERRTERNFFILAFLGLIVKLCNFALGSQFTLAGFLINVFIQPLEAIIFTSIQFVSMFLDFFLFLISNSRLNFPKLKHEELKIRFKSIASLVKSFNDTLGFLVTSVLAHIILSVIFEVS